MKQTTKNSGKCVENVWKYVEICGNMWKRKTKETGGKNDQKNTRGPAPEMLMPSGSDLILKVNGTQLSHPATW